MPYNLSVEQRPRRRWNAPEHGPRGATLEQSEVYQVVPLLRRALYRQGFPGRQAVQLQPRLHGCRVSQPDEGQRQSQLPQLGSEGLSPMRGALRVLRQDGQVLLRGLSGTFATQSLQGGRLAFRALAARFGVSFGVVQIMHGAVCVSGLPELLPSVLAGTLRECTRSSILRHLPGTVPRLQNGCQAHLLSRVLARIPLGSTKRRTVPQVARGQNRRADVAAYVGGLRALALQRVRAGRIHMLSLQGARRQIGRSPHKAGSAQARIDICRGERNHALLVVPSRHPLERSGARGCISSAHRALLNSKTETGKLRPEQACWLEELKACPGVETFVWRPSDWEELRGTLARKVAA